MQLRLNSDEIEAMAGMPLLPRCVYVFGIRPHMDYATGLVGVKRGVSWQSIAESCFIEHHQGRQDAGTPHKSRIRRAVAELEREGLITTQSSDRRLVFKCLMATADDSDQEKPDRRPTHVRHTKPDTQPDTPEVTRSKVYRLKPDTKPDTRPTHPVEEKPDTPPVSGIRKDKETPTDVGAKKSRKSALDLSALPNELSNQVWADWVQYRKDIKCPVNSQTVVNRVAGELKKAMEAGWAPDDALAESMVAGWRGVKAQWLQNRTKSEEPTGHKRREGFSGIDYEAEAKQAGFKTGF